MRRRNKCFKNDVLMQENDEKVGCLPFGCQRADSRTCQDSDSDSENCVCVCVCVASISSKIS